VPIIERNPANSLLVRVAEDSEKKRGSVNFAEKHPDFDVFYAIFGTIIIGEWSQSTA
jgi:hypothetical protein